ncbi:hypothetical protein [Solimonas sp. SE-A11]|uniref:hypothetical protein n=1 Tax=Solimonas sp. SE-A11 TaxID=3054954 RepID=UPI00259C73D4|nr:hypothetical protein [Solimonas sp. SE-A11]MDM4769256.1 hypothetical protein [Solimonas sp. SE-A11]
MANEFNIFITKKELETLLRKAHVDGFKIQESKKLPSPNAEYCLSEADIASALARKQHAFLLEHDDFMRNPIEIMHVKRGVREFWHPFSSVGGPVIEVHYFEPFEENGQLIVPCSLFSYLSKTKNPQSGMAENAGKDIKRVFSDFITPLKESSRKVVSTKRSAYVTPQVEDLLKCGWKLAYPFDLVPIV